MEPRQLETQAQEVTRASSSPPYLFQLGPKKGRLALDKVQDPAAGAVAGPDMKVEDHVLAIGPSGRVSVKILKPSNVALPMPVILYIHGAGWVFGNAHTHDRLIRELAAGAGAAVVFPNYSLSPEAKYPVAIEEIYAVAMWIADHGSEFGLDAKNLVIAGDSVGGNMAAAVTLLAKARGGPDIGRQLLFYPVTDASFDTLSYRRFSTGFMLRRDAMQWFWDQYTQDPEERLQITASPLRASLDDLKGLPEALVITAEADPLCDEGEAYASKLRQAGVRTTAVRFEGIIHDFVMLNALAGTAAARGAMELATGWMRRGWQAP